MKIVVIGAKGTIGSAVVKALSLRHEIIPCGRTNSEFPCDITSEESITKLFEKIGAFDALISAAGKVHFEDFEKMSAAKYNIGLTDKLMGQVNLVRIGMKFIKDHGSFTLTSGILNWDPIRTATSGAMVNGALEGFVKAAAIELSRGVRINLVSPTVILESMEKYEAYFRGFKPVSAQDAALAYIKSTEGHQTGQIYRVG